MEDWLSENWAELANVTVSALLLLVTGLGVTAATRSLKAARQNNQTARLALLAGLANEWSQARDSWKLAQALVRGTDDYYATTLRTQVDQIEEASHSYLENRWIESVAVNEIRVEIESLVQFFDRLCIELLEGVLRPSDVYTVLGPEVARHSRVVRWLVGIGGSDLRRSGNDPDLEYGWLDSVTSNELPGRKARIVYLSDALWSELAQKRDLRPHNICTAATHKRINGTGAIARRRAYDLGVSSGGRRVGLRLAFHLTFAEFVPLAACTEFGKRTNVNWDPLTVRSVTELKYANGVRGFWQNLWLSTTRYFPPRRTS